MLAPTGYRRSAPPTLPVRSGAMKLNDEPRLPGDRSWVCPDLALSVGLELGHRRTD